MATSWVGTGTDIMVPSFVLIEPERERFIVHRSLAAAHYRGA